mmetsp:Transcript_16192/g.23769  ORF Transcript_16192/g.23769 Transcript_16192/m.23769 type:complete len:96 (-) Transcript_16192:3481-3768(-)
MITWMMAYPNSIWRAPGWKVKFLLPYMTNNDLKLSFKGIEKATHLKTLHLSSTSIDNMEDNDNAPDSLINSHLAECQFKDEIPPEFYKLSNLQIA